MEKTVTCIGCPMGCMVTVTFGADGNIESVSGNTCKRGEDYARKEVTSPARVVTSIVKVEDGDEKLVSVRTAADIPKEKIFDCMNVLKTTIVKAPVKIGDVVVHNVCNSGIDVIATKNIKKK